MMSDIAQINVDNSFEELNTLDESSNMNTHNDIDSFACYDIGMSHQNIIELNRILISYDGNKTLQIPYTSLSQDQLVDFFNDFSAIVATDLQLSIISEVIMKSINKIVNNASYNIACGMKDAIYDAYIGPVLT